MRVWSTAIYKSIVLLSLIICLRKGYAFEHLEQFHLHALLRRALRKVRDNNSSLSGQAAACTELLELPL